MFAMRLLRLDLPQPYASKASAVAVTVGLGWLASAAPPTLHLTAQIRHTKVKGVSSKRS
jgi:hypothetical protein